LQNRVYLTDPLQLLVGLRFDQLEAVEEGVASDHDRLSAQLGLVYQLTPLTSLYGSYSESFLPNFPDIPEDVANDVSSLAPEQAYQFEVGLSSSLLDKRLDLSAALYHLTRNNVKTFERNRARLNAEEVSHGLEISANMHLTSGFSLLASYAYIDSEIRDDNDPLKSTEGNRPFNLPQQQARISGAYQFRGGRLAGVGVRLGAEYVSDRFTDNENSASVPSYTLYDAAAWYRVRLDQGKTLRLQLGVRNLTNKRYYQLKTNNRPFNYKIGDPRTLYLSAQLNF